MLRDPVGNDFEQRGADWLPPDAEEFAAQTLARQRREQERDDEARRLSAEREQAQRKKQETEQYYQRWLAVWNGLSHAEQEAVKGQFYRDHPLFAGRENARGEYGAMTMFAFRILRREQPP